MRSRAAIQSARTTKRRASVETMTTIIPPIVLAFETAASPAEAWAALTEPDRIAEWFTDASPLGGVGSEYRLDFGDGSVVEGVVTELEHGRRFAYSWAWSDGDGRQETLVTWSVEPRPNGRARISLVHDGWAEAGLDASARDDHEGYWAGYLDDLLSVLEPAG
jgi:uncharacterized protein YndB with AHSA1/START domain